MLVSNMSVIGWLHSLACTLALLLGAMNIVLAKGTRLHRRAGRIYFYTMVIANLTARLASIISTSRTFGRSRRGRTRSASSIGKRLRP